MSFFGDGEDVRDRIEGLVGVILAVVAKRRGVEHFALDDFATMDDDLVTLLPASYLREICNAPAEIERLQDALKQRDYDALSALELIFGGDISRVVQGVRS